MMDLEYTEIKLHGNIPHIKINCILFLVLLNTVCTISIVVFIGGSYMEFIENKNKITTTITKVVHVSEKIDKIIYSLCNSYYIEKLFGGYLCNGYNTTNIQKRGGYIYKDINKLISCVDKCNKKMTKK